MSIDSIDQVIDALGGTDQVSRDLGVEAPVVSNWRSRGRIPGARWTALADIARGRGVNGITLETLADLHAKRPVGSDA